MKKGSCLWFRLLSIVLVLIAFCSAAQANTAGTQKWFFDTPGSTFSSPAIGADGTIYFGTYSNLYALNPDGSLKWFFPTGAEISSAPAIDKNGTIYIGSWDSNLYAINQDGTKKWVFGTGGQIWSSPAIGTDGTIYVGSWDTNLYAINPDGTKKWAFKTMGMIASSPSIASDGTIYLGAGSLYAINPNGTEKWSHGGGIDAGYIFMATATSSPSIDHDGTIYIGGQINSFDANYNIVTSNGLVAFTPNGAMKWAFAIKDGSLNLGPLASPAIGADGTIYFGANDGKFYAISSNGTEKWEIDFGGIVDASPAIGADGTIYVGASSNLYALNPEGTIKWFVNGGGASMSSPVIATEGTLYVGGNSGYFALYVDSKGIANSPWPMFGHDHFRSSNYNVETSSSPSNPPLPPQMSYTFNDLDISITWESVSGATGYTLSYAPFPYTGPDSIRSIDLGNQTSFPYHLWSGAAFYITVQAYNDQGTSNYSNIEYFIIP